MLKDDSKIQLDLSAALGGRQDSVFGEVPLKFERELGTVFVDFSRAAKAGTSLFDRLLLLREAGHGGEVWRLPFRKDPAGRPWIYTSCEMQGASVWWPNKDQWRDEVESMDLSVTIPNDLVDVSNGRFARQDRPGRRLHALGLARQLSDQQLLCVAQHRHIMFISTTSWAT